MGAADEVIPVIYGGLRWDGVWVEGEPLTLACIDAEVERQVRLVAQALRVVPPDFPRVYLHPCALVALDVSGTEVSGVMGAPQRSRGVLWFADYNVPHDAALVLVPQYPPVLDSLDDLLRARDQRKAKVE